MNLLPRLRLLSPLCLALLLGACSGNERPSPPPAVVAPPAATTPVPKVRVGIALGGGAAKGFAHIGVIKMLEANGIQPVVVSGTSAGSVVGALYASGMDAFQMQQHAVALDEASIRDVRLFSGGLVQGQKLQDYVNEKVGKRPIQKLKLPFAAVATQLATGERTVFVIAVDISSKANGIDSSTSMLGNINQSIRIMGNKLGALELQRADIVIRPKVNDIGPADFEQKNRAILEGERAAQAALSQIKAKIAALQAARTAKARQAADTEAARQREAERKARCAKQQGWMDKLTRDPDCRDG